ncbi:hypothetical protein BWI15_28195 [Kribbella sp. ALI-6-A]|nr:hypothetical protein BWI15_28195 [Kribbella sp. ALI-6-A]
MVDNGLDFLERAVGELAESPPDNKYAALHLCSAIEVLIKARLIREHWTLACSKPDGATQASFAAGDVVTVDPMQGLKRLQSVVGLTISGQQTSNVDSVRRLRNRAAHFAFVHEDEIAVRTVLGRGLDFALWFLGNHIRPGAPGDEAEAIDQVMDDITGALTAIKGFVKERLESLAGDLEAAGVLLACPRCEQATLTMPEGEAPKCLFCFWASIGEGGADEYVSSVLSYSHYQVIKDGGTWPVHSCLNCGDRALVHGIEVLKDSGKALADLHDPYLPPVFGCFSCSYLGTRLDLDECGSCGEFTDSGMSVCSDCFEYAVSGD